MSCASIRIAQRAVRKIELPVADLPAFLCPGILSIRPRPTRSTSIKQPRPFQQVSQRRLLSTAPSTDIESRQPSLSLPLERLPQQCPGCGALSQFVDVDEPGFYTLTRKNVREYLGVESAPNVSVEDAIVKAALKNAGTTAENLNLEGSSKPCKNPVS
jgi:genetic interactor of prohibitins 3, mitochondrial